MGELLAALFVVNLVLGAFVYYQQMTIQQIKRRHLVQHRQFKANRVLLTNITPQVDTMVADSKQAKSDIAELKNKVSHLTNQTKSTTSRGLHG